MSNYIILAGVVVLYMVIYAIIWSKTHPTKMVTKEVITETSAPTVNVAEIVLEAYEGLAVLFEDNNIKSNTKAYKILHAQIDSLKDAE